MPSSPIADGSAPSTISGLPSSSQPSSSMSTASSGGAVPANTAVTAAFAAPSAIATAQQAVMELKVLLATEIASELGVTIAFGDADGDS